MSEVTKEQIDQFLSGTDPMERIIKIECDYSEDKVTIVYNDENGVKRMKKEPFYPFVWCKRSAAQKLFNGDREKIKYEMSRYGIGVKGLRVEDSEGNVPPRMENGYRLMFYAKVSMSYQTFMDFFTDGGRPIYPDSRKYANYGVKEYIAVLPVEQYMISTGRRLFKGYEDYDELNRMQWDLETEGLDPKIDAISQIGIRTNRGFEKIIKITGIGEDKRNNESAAIDEFFETIKELKPDIISGHNTENFDWNFISVRLTEAGTSLYDRSKKFFPRGVYKKKKQSVLKLGGEMEYYYPTVMWGYNLTDSLFAVRRAQALDSNMKKADLKYVTKYSKLNKPNRVYVPGKIINQTWEDDTKSYALNDENGNWFKITSDALSKTFEHDGVQDVRYTLLDGNELLFDNSNGDEYKVVTGTYIVERYLMDDLYETDKVEARYNQSNFLVGKMLPVSYEKMCTMGTAAIWKYIMLAWSYEHNLAVPELIPSHSFTGGLSRLISVGYVDNVVKLDYNSLYPSIILTFNIKSDIDLMGAMNALLEYILTQREHYKELKGIAGGNAKDIKKMLDKNPNIENRDELKRKQLAYEADAARNDKMQLPLKIIGNGFFGSYGSGSVFPWSDLECAEETTCTGRMMLRLMISHFTKLGYKPIVGDSFTEDTPLFIKHNDNNDIDIVPIFELLNQKEIQVDELGREYDTSKKNFKVLCRSGWKTPSYIYRHKTDKPIYRVIDKTTLFDVTEDHSVFNANKEKIKPSEITNDTKLERLYGGKGFISNVYELDDGQVKKLAVCTANNVMKRVTRKILNCSKSNKEYFLKVFDEYKRPDKPYSKQLLASINYMRYCVKNG